MRGVILSFDTGSGTGTITGDDGQSYDFSRASLTTPATLRDGLRVDFSPVDGQATQIMLLETQPFAQSTSPWNNAGPPPAAGSTAIDWQPLFLSFNGRIRRSHFWIAWLILLGVGTVLNFIPIVGLLGFILIWPNLAITVKRLHDMGHTGWLAVIPWVVNIIGFIIAAFTVGAAAISGGLTGDNMDNADPATILALMGPMFGIFGILALINLGFLLWIGIQDGQPGTNRFGPNPKHPVDPDVFG